MAKPVRRRQKAPYAIIMIAAIIVALWGRRSSISYPKLIINSHTQVVIGVMMIGGALIIGWILSIKRSISRPYINALKKAGISDPMSLSGVEYEEFCALMLQEKGWKTEPTSVTGDFGADIVASKRGVRLVVQCKRYKAPVGVKAVQEVHSAAAYYKAHKTAVITCTGFTRAAFALARRTNTALVVLGRDKRADLSKI